MLQLSGLGLQRLLLTETSLSNVVAFTQSEEGGRRPTRVRMSARQKSMVKARCMTSSEVKKEQASDVYMRWVKRERIRSNLPSSPEMGIGFLAPLVVSTRGSDSSVA